MKTVFTLMLILGSLHSFAQIVDVDTETGAVFNAYLESEEVKNVVEQVEQEYGVSCTEKSPTLIDISILKHITYKVECIGNKPVKLKITSKYNYVPVCFDESPWSFKVLKVVTKF